MVWENNDGMITTRSWSENNNACNNGMISLCATVLCKLVVHVEISIVAMNVKFY
jgi:hypothetical protein